MYDKKTFLKILKEIINSYDSQNAAAKKMGISSSYITKIFDENTKNAPAPEYLKKIADNSHGKTTYLELMQICGHLPKDYIKKEEKHQIAFFNGIESLSEKDKELVQNLIDSLKNKNK